MVKKNVTQKVTETVYEASDGKEFRTEYACILYEKTLTAKRLEPQLREFRIEEATNMMPLTLTEMMEYRNYEWYRVTKEEELELLEERYEIEIDRPARYPEVFCIESRDDVPFDCYYYTLSGCRVEIERFFDTLGETA